MIESNYAKVIERYNEKEEQLLLKNKCVNLKKLSCFVQLIRNGWIISMRWISFVKVFILRAYGQIDPLREYQFEGFAMFEDMIASIEEEVAKYIMKAEIRNNLERQEVAKGQAVNPKEEDGEKVKKKPVVKGKKLDEMILCPCGSGKKYKNCCGN